jgi:class IV lanthipeptide synthase
MKRYRKSALDLIQRWNDLCARYLPLCANGSAWRFSREASPDEPQQGWKLHVSSTVLNGCDILSLVAPLLVERGVQFKAPASLEEIRKINSGVYYGYSQVGKILTIYPNSSDEAVALAQLVAEATQHLFAPDVPFEEKFGNKGCVFYRYGAFRQLDLETSDGRRQHAIKNPDGELISDDRYAADYVPPWTTDPFAKYAPPSPDTNAGPLAGKYLAFEAITQRGRGGVYRALDVSTKDVRDCIIKEGRCAGEMTWDGRDGVRRIQNEQLVLESLRLNNANVPHVYDTFEEENNAYLVLEFIEGQTLHEWLTKRKRRLSIRQCLQIGEQVSSILARVHSAGWLWRDCKTSNFMMTKTGELRPIDFEGACPASDPDEEPWGTYGFTPPSTSRVNDDLYALGAMLYFLFSGRLQLEAQAPVEKMRSGTPAEVCRVIEQLLSDDPAQQPAAEEVARILAQCKILTAGRPRRAAPTKTPRELSVGAVLCGRPVAA